MSDGEGYGYHYLQLEGMIQPMNVIKRAQKLMARHEWQQAAQILDEALTVKPTDIDALTLRADVAIVMQDLPYIHQLLERSCTLSPESAALAAFCGKTWLRIGESKPAIAEFHRALTIDEECEVFDDLARANLPGPTYTEHLQWLHQHRKPRVYLEIGIFRGETLRLAAPATQAIGVDPDPRIKGKIESNIKIFRMKSDAFFQKTADKLFLDKGPISLAFIDGLHLFEQVLTDVIHVEKYCDAGSVIVLHDTLPLAAIPAERERKSQFWCGDVWKILPCLRHYRPDLCIVTVPTYPTGLTFITRTDPENRILETHKAEALQRYRDLPFSAHRAQIDAMLREIPNTLTAAWG